MSESDSGSKADSSSSISSDSNYRRNQSNRHQTPPRLDHDQSALPNQTGSQDQQPVQQLTTHPMSGNDVIELKISRGKSKKLRKLVKFGLSNARVSAPRNRFSPKFQSGKCKVGVTELDDAFYEKLKIVKLSMKLKENIDSRGTDWREVQFKVLDIVRPILFIWGTSKVSGKKAAKAAIRLWAHAHFSITALRRKNILKQTHPTHMS